MARCWSPTRTTARPTASPMKAGTRAGRRFVLGNAKWWRPPAIGLAAAVVCAGPVLPQNGPLAEKIQLCGACHGEDGNSKMEKIPSLAGQPAFFILNQLFLMREGVRKVEAMAPVVKDLKDEDLDALSKHF